MNNGPENLNKGVVFCRTYSEASEKLEQVLQQSISNGDRKAVKLFQVYVELKIAFEKKLFKN